MEETTGYSPSPMPRFARLTILVAALIAAAVVLAFVVFPSGADTPLRAATSDLQSKADQDTVRILVTQRWGEGEMVLARFDRRGRRMLRLAFASKGTRGWRRAGATEKRADLTDVAVGSMLVARSAGGKGQPEWSAAAGELGDRRIQRIEIRWTTGKVTTGVRRNDSYLIVEGGSLAVASVRFLTANGTEIATVPVGRS